MLLHISSALVQLVCYSFAITLWLHWRMRWALLNEVVGESRDKSVRNASSVCTIGEGVLLKSWLLLVMMVRRNYPSRVITTIRAHMMDIVRCHDCSVHCCRGSCPRIVWLNRPWNIHVVERFDRLLGVLSGPTSPRRLGWS